MNFLSKEYLPNSEERIGHLRRIINGRTVAILAAGPSINDLEKRISELRDADICYFGFNEFVQETYILQQIGQHLSVFMDSARENIPPTIKDTIYFLNRDEDNILISSLYPKIFELMNNDFALNQFLSKYDRKLIFFYLFEERTVPNSDYPLHFTHSNSLQVLIQLAIIGKASRIVLFGADGYCKENIKEYYFRQGEYPPAPREHLIFDTKRFNAATPIAIRNTYETYNLAPIDILNCSENSFYTAFPKVSYDDAFEYLLMGKKYTRKSDLRVPKVSIISAVVNTGVFFKEAVESVSNQPYSNHEHIVIYDEEDDEIQDMMRQFPHIRWFREKNCNYLQAFKKGISMARGEYMFHYRITDRYLNQDWINTCVEVLENNPDVSLVWGLSQIMAENGAPERIINDEFLDNPPSQRKDFIYYWLKKKILFPEGNFCVRKKILEECFPFHGSKASDEREAWIAFNYRFNTSGYLPYFIPTVANYFRGQNDIKERKQSADPSVQRWVKEYCEDIEQYKKKLIRRKITHCYRNESGEISSYGFSRIIFLFFDIIRYVKAKHPLFEKALDYGMTYRWAVFRVVIVKVWHRLIKI